MPFLVSVNTHDSFVGQYNASFFTHCDTVIYKVIQYKPNEYLRDEKENSFRDSNTCSDVKQLLGVGK